MTGKEFEKEYRELYLPLCMYALRLVGDTDEAREIVQSVFTSLWQSVQNGFTPINLKSYLYKAVRNSSLSFLKEQSKQTEFIAEDQDVAEETIDTSERDARLWKAIDDLPEKTRQVFLFSKRDGMSNKEIAEEMGISIKTVENQMTRAMKHLRKAYGISEGSKPMAIFFLPFL